MDSPEGDGQVLTDFARTGKLDVKTIGRHLIKTDLRRRDLIEDHQIPDLSVTSFLNKENQQDERQMNEVQDDPLVFYNGHFVSHITPAFSIDISRSKTLRSF